jgi:hypothetical protein
MVFAVQCPNPKCRKFMLVEDSDLNKVIPCLLCKTAIKIAGPPPEMTGGPSASAPPSAPPVRR